MRTFFNAFVGGSLLMFGALAAAPAVAGPCEGIQNAFAYNNCLAKEGPQKRGRAPRAGRGVDPESTVRGRARYNPSADDGGPARGVRISRHRGGRSRAVIDPWGAIKRSLTPSRKKRRR